jgi:chromosome segregation ATPase
MFQRLGGWSANWKKEKAELINELELCHDRENAAAAGVAAMKAELDRFKAENARLRGREFQANDELQGLKKALEEQYQLYAHLRRDYGSVQDQLKNARREIEEAREAQRKLTMSIAETMRRKGFETQSDYDQLWRNYQALNARLLRVTQGIHNGMSRREIKRLLNSEVKVG